MKILVTGANGYLGQGIVKRILDLGYEVVATDFRTDNVDGRATRVEANMFEIENPYEFYGKPDVLLHLAWRDGFVHNSHAHFEDLPKHYHFIDEMISAGVKRVAVMGTMHEIGFYEGCINEDTVCKPMNYYGISKDALRNAVKVMAGNKGIPFQWLRAYYIVGNSKFGNSIFSKITAAEEAGNEYFPFTTGRNQYDFIDYEDFCNQVACAVVQDEVCGIINICSGYPEKLATRVERFIEENGYSIKLEYGAFSDRPYDSKAVWADGRKIEQIINAKK